MKTGFIGLGAMGMHMARNLHKAGLLAGAFAAFYQNKWPDYLLVFVVLIPLIIPNFLMANLA